MMFFPISNGVSQPMGSPGIDKEVCDVAFGGYLDQGEGAGDLMRLSREANGPHAAVESIVDYFDVFPSTTVSFLCGRNHGPVLVGRRVRFGI